MIGILSSLVPNIPLVVAMVPLLKMYLVNVGLVGAEVLNSNFSGEFPPEVLPLFYAMMYGATLGGNGTLIGASSNIVAAGIVATRSYYIHRVGRGPHGDHLGPHGRDRTRDFGNAFAAHTQGHQKPAKLRWCCRSRQDHLKGFAGFFRAQGVTV